MGSDVCVALQASQSKETSEPNSHGLAHYTTDQGEIFSTVTSVYCSTLAGRKVGGGFMQSTGRSIGRVLTSQTDKTYGLFLTHEN